MRLIVGIVLALVAVFLVTVGSYEGRKAYWDWRIGMMCEKDGGLAIVNGSDLHTRRQQDVRTSDVLTMASRGSRLYVEHTSVDVRSSDACIPYRNEISPKR